MFLFSGCGKSINNKDTSVKKNLSMHSTKLSMHIGDKAVITFNNDSSNNPQEVKYFSENPDVVSVDNKGIISALSVDSTDVYVVSNGESTKINVSVYPPEKPLPTSLTLVPSFEIVESGDQVNVQSKLKMSDGNFKDVSSESNWKSNSEEICNVDNNGLVSTFKEGECVIEAEFDGYSSVKSLKVVFPREKTIYSCEANIDTESEYKPLFVSQNMDNISYKEYIVNKKLSVLEIESMFNYARSMDPTVSDPMVLPPQDVWDQYDASEKVLYLVNAERCARGIRPLEGIDPILRDKVTVPYAIFLTTHKEEFLQAPHESDGRTPGDRMDEFGISLGDTSTYYGENIVMFNTFTSSVEESEAKSVYAWFYQDKQEDYGHRMNLLQAGLRDDTGVSGKEGLLGASTQTIKSSDENGVSFQTYTVMDFFDPTKNWEDNVGEIESVPLYKFLD